MYPFRRETLATLTLTPAVDAGQRRVVQLAQNTFTHLVYVLVTTTVQITTAVTSIKWPGSAAQALDWLGLSENNYDRILIDGRIGAFIGQMRADSPLTHTVLADKAAATYVLKEVIPLWLSNPMGLNPGETAFRERNPVAPVNFFCQLSPNAVGNLVTGGVATVQSVKVEVVQFHNPNQKRLPWFVPFWSQQTWQVPSSNPVMRIPLMTDRYLSALILNGESSNGMQPDVINAFRLMSDVRTYVGPQMQAWEMAGRQQELSFGGAVYGPVAAAGNYSITASATKPVIVGLDFQHHGQLSTVIEPNETNLRLEIDCQPAASGNNTLIRTTMLELVRDLSAYTAPGGGSRIVCNPSPLPWLRPR